MKHFIVELDAIRMKRSNLVIESGNQVKHDAKAAPPAYLKAFRSRGFDLETGDPATLAAQVNSSPIRAELIAFLDDWAVIEPPAPCAMTTSSST